MQDSSGEQDRRECKRDHIVLSGFCVCPILAKGDEGHELEDKRK